MIKKLTIILGIIFCTPLVNAQVINLEHNLKQVTVHINLYDDKDNWFCSGVVIKNTPYESEVLTAKHCVNGKKKAEIGDVVSSKFVKAPYDDMAIIYFNQTLPNKLVVKIAYDKNNNGDKVYTFGYPLGKEKFSEGTITSVGMFNAYSNFYVNHGASGSGVFNESGELVGIVWGMMFKDTHQAVFEPLKDVKKFLNNLEQL
jgi:S1-C subfamily serine protease